MYLNILNSGVGESLFENFRLVTSLPSTLNKGSFTSFFTEVQEVIAHSKQTGSIYFIINFVSP